MIRFYENQEERNTIQKMIDQVTAFNLNSFYHPEKYLSIFVDEKTNIVKNYQYSDAPIMCADVPGSYFVDLGQADIDTYNTAIMCIDDCLDTYPVYDPKTKELGIVALIVKPVNCTYDEKTGKYSLNENEETYKFHISVFDPIEKGVDHFGGLYIKQQDKNSESVSINNKNTSKLVIKNKSTVSIKNLKGSEQTFKIKATLLNEESIWLVKYITVM